VDWASKERHQCGNWTPRCMRVSTAFLTRHICKLICSTLLFVVLIRRFFVFLGPTKTRSLQWAANQQVKGNRLIPTLSAEEMQCGLSAEQFKALDTHCSHLANGKDRCGCYSPPSWPIVPTDWHITARLAPLPTSIQFHEIFDSGYCLVSVIFFPVAHDIPLICFTKYCGYCLVSVIFFQ
jgi:hypothetical protein